MFGGGCPDWSADLHIGTQTPQTRPGFGWFWRYIGHTLSSTPPVEIRPEEHQRSRVAQKEPVTQRSAPR